MGFKFNLGEINQMNKKSVPFLLLSSMLFTACSTSTTIPETYAEITPVQPVEVIEEVVVEDEPIVEVVEAEYLIGDSWLALYSRLKEDKVESEKLAEYFSELPSAPSQDPMGRKIRELYGYKFIKKDPNAPKKSPKYDYPPAGYTAPGPWYKGIVTESIAEKCIDFINTYPEAFAKAEAEYKVPKEVIAALLFIETRLGGYLGKENAFVTLASMASTDNYSDIPDWTKKLPNNPEEKESWITETMEKRSDWAYNEFKALTEVIIENELDPYAMPGSIYGAIGLCQFMPSNIKKYAADGNEDGKINLFEPEDAIVSVGKYLQKHNWKENSSLTAQHKVLKKYNNLNVYANSILGLAEKITLVQ